MLRRRSSGGTVRLSQEDFLRAFILDVNTIRRKGPDIYGLDVLTENGKVRRVSDLIDKLTKDQQRIEVIIAETTSPYINWSYYFSFKYGFRQNIPVQSSTTYLDETHRYRNNIKFDEVFYQQAKPCEEIPARITWREGNVNPGGGDPKKGIYIADGTHRAFAMMGRIARGEEYVPFENEFHGDGLGTVMELMQKFENNPTGSSTHSNHTGKQGPHAYHNLPFIDLQIQHHRPIDERLKYIKPIGTHGIDLGCNVGGFTFSLQLQGKQMIGVDNDPPTINVAEEIERLYLTGARFVCQDISEALIADLASKYGKNGQFDFALWLSQYHWIVNHFGAEAAKQILQTVGKFCRELYFETRVNFPEKPEQLLRDVAGYSQVQSLTTSLWTGDVRTLYHCKRMPKL